MRLQTCRTAHAKAAHSQVISRSVHFPVELAAAPAVCMLRWLSKEGTGRALIQLRRFQGAKAGRKITNFDICSSLQVSYCSLVGCQGAQTRPRAVTPHGCFASLPTLFTQAAVASPFLAYQEILVLAVIKEGACSYTTLSCHQWDPQEGGGE